MNSFFSAENMFDGQLQGQRTDALTTYELVEAAARRMALLEGPATAAGKLYRVADICAGAYVLPHEFWMPPATSMGSEAVDDPPPAASLPAAPRDRKGEGLRLLASYMLSSFIAGVGLGWLLLIL